MTKRICFFTPTYDNARQVIMNYYEKISPLDVEIFVVSSRDIPSKFKLKRSKMLSLNKGRLTSIIGLRTFVIGNKIDLLVNLAGNSNIAIAFLLSTIGTKTKTIFFFNGNPINKDLWAFPLTQFFTHRFIAISKEVEERFKKNFFFSRDKTFYLPYPIDTNKFKPINKINAKERVNLPLDKDILIYVGRIEYEQGSDYLLNLIKENPNRIFLLIGEIRDNTFKNETFPNVIHKEFIAHEEIPNYYNAADLSLFFTRRNSYPFPPRESLSCGTPVVVFDIGSFRFMNTRAVLKTNYCLRDIQERIDFFFNLSEKEKKILAKEGRDFIIDDSSEEIIKDKTLRYLFD